MCKATLTSKLSYSKMVVSVTRYTAEAPGVVLADEPHLSVSLSLHLPRTAQVTPDVIIFGSSSFPALTQKKLKKVYRPPRLTSTSVL